MSDSTFDLNDTVGDTTVKYADLLSIGTAVLNSVTASQMMRHVSPSGLIEYVDPGEDFGVWVLLDLLKWVRFGIPEDSSASRARLIRYVQITGWQAAHLADFNNITVEAAS